MLGIWLRRGARGLIKCRRIKAALADPVVPVDGFFHSEAGGAISLRTTEFVACSRKDANKRVGCMYMRVCVSSRRPNYPSRIAWLVPSVALSNVLEMSGVSSFPIEDRQWLVRPTTIERILIHALSEFYSAVVSRLIVIAAVLLFILRH